MIQLSYNKGEKYKGQKKSGIREAGEIYFAHKWHCNYRDEHKLEGVVEEEGARLRKVAVASGHNSLYDGRLVQTLLVNTPSSSPLQCPDSALCHNPLERNGVHGNHYKN